MLWISAQDGLIVTAATPALAPACRLPQGREAEAQRVLMQCVHATPDMAHELMLRLRCSSLLPGACCQGRPVVLATATACVLVRSAQLGL